MKLDECLRMGYICGLETVRESVNNILRFSGNMFGYDAAIEEENELIEDFEKSGLNDKDVVRLVLEKAYHISTQEIDNQIENDLNGSTKIL
jgi:hypothetical protein